MNKQQLANKIWESANKMRSKIEANEYKDYILGFIFYKFLSDKEVEYLKKAYWTDEDLPELTEDDEKSVDQCKKNLGYFIEYKNLFSTWISMGKAFDVSNVTDALSAFDRNINDTHKAVFEKIFDTLQTGLSKLGESSGARTKAIGNLIRLIKDIPMDEKQGYDVLGFIYEYLISNFAANAGKKAGEFYTPHEVSVLMSEIVANHLKDAENISIYDPTSGSGSLLINIGKSASKYLPKENIVYYAQELKENTYNLTRMNLIMRGISPSQLFTRNADTLEEDWPVDPEKFPPVLRVDAVVSNPPYSQQWDPDEKESDSRYNEYGIAPKSKADYAFLLHDLYHINANGIMAIVLPHGVLFRGGDEEKIRKNLIEKNKIDTIIGLPANIFFGTGIPTIIMILKQTRTEDDVLIIDASKGFVKEGKNNRLQASDIKRIVDTVRERKSVDKFSKVVSREEIRNNEYNLNIPRYVDSSEESESWDIYASMNGGIPNREIDRLSQYWSAFPSLRKDLFESDGTPYSTISKDNVKEFISEHDDVKKYRERYTAAFNGFEGYLSDKLITGMKDVQPVKDETVIGDDIFRRLSDIPIIDRYKAYQILDDCWNIISYDFDILTTEGYDSVKAVDPNMVVKKNSKKKNEQDSDDGNNSGESEVQEGWKGRILPFELVQRFMLTDELNAIKAKETRSAEIDSEIEELFESLSEEDKDSDITNDTNDAFNSKGVTIKLKELKKPDTEEDKQLKVILSQFEKITREQKDINKEIKVMAAELHLKTKETIENLSDEECNMLLKEKWIMPLVNDIYSLPEQMINELEKSVQALNEKYKDTMIDLEDDIKTSEKSLCGMIDELTANEFDLKGLEQFKLLLGGE